MKILWLSNAPWAATGYGTQTAQMLPRLRDAGHDVAVFANYGLNGSMMDWEGFPVYPSGAEPWGNDVVKLWARDWFGDEPGLVVTLYDTWVFEAKAFDGLHVASWAPVDHVPVPPRVMKWFEESGAWPIAYSKFGKLSLEANGLDPVLYAPHAIDTNIYKPIPVREAKRMAGFPEDRFLVGMVAANLGINPPRKAWDVGFRAFGALLASHPDALLYIHSEAKGRYAKGLDLEALLTQYDIGPDNVLFVDQLAYRLGRISAEKMAIIYSAFDVLSSATLGEGFGLPVLEAQACGCPVIVNNFSAQPELRGSGWITQGQLWYDPGQAADFSIPSDRDLATKLKMARENMGNEQLRELAREFALGYDADLVFKRDWLPILEMLEQTVCA